MNANRLLEKLTGTPKILLMVSGVYNVFNIAAIVVVAPFALLIFLFFYVRWPSLDPVQRKVVSTGSSFLGAALLLALFNFNGNIPDWMMLNLAWAAAWLVWLLVCAGALRLAYTQRRALETFVFPERIPLEVRKLVPTPLADAQIAELIEGFRGYLRIVQRDGPGHAMPSRGVDAVWHAFLMMTRDYAAFCQRINGGMIHHLPVGPDCEYTRRAAYKSWLACCRDEGINADTPERLPLLFTYDARFGIPNAMHFSVEAGIFPFDPDTGKSPCRLKGELARAKSCQPGDEMFSEWAASISRALFSEAWMRAYDEASINDFVQALRQNPPLFEAVFPGSTAFRRWEGALGKIKNEQEIVCGC